jgi:hypothetical protein
MRIVAIVLLVAGVLALVYRGFSYREESREAKVGPLEITVEKDKRVAIPVWAGVALVVVGAGMLVAGKK